MKRRQHRRPQNPYNSNRPSSHRGLPIHKITFSNATALLTLLATLLLWFTSPIADVIANIALSTVPLQADVDLGLQTWNQQMKYHYPPVYDRWGVAEIGSELVQEGGQRTARDYCRRTKKMNNPTSSLEYDTCMKQIQTYPWSFTVVDSTQINAFALPGGIICVTNALLTTLNLNRGEIAALLGHEMGHILHRHSQLQLMKKDLLHTLLHALLHSSHDSTASDPSRRRRQQRQQRYGEEVEETAATIGDYMGQVLFQGMEFLGDMKFSRANEYQADAVAWDLLVSSRVYDPRHVQNLLQKLWSLERHGRGDGKTSWEMTHPGTADRIEALQAKWESESSQESWY